MQIARTLRRAREPDLTPLIDIVFQLVIFFMLTTSFVAAESIELALPSGENVAPAPVVSEKSDEIMRIQIRSTGHVTIDDEAVTASQLEDQIILRIVKNPELQVKLFSTPGVSVQQLISVMDLVSLNHGRYIEVDKLEYADDAAPTSSFIENGDIIEGGF